MTQEILDWLTQVKSDFPIYGQVVEIGALDVNGTARSVLQSSNHVWTGLDLQAGKDVDVVTNARKFLLDRVGCFDAVVACESYEHDAEWWRTHAFACGALRPPGIFVFTSPTIGFPYHDYGGDYYRFTEDAVRKAIFPKSEFDILHFATVGVAPFQCVCALAKKKKFL